MYLMLQVLINIKVNGSLIPLSVNLILQLCIIGYQNVEYVRLVLQFSLLFSSLFYQLRDFILLFIHGQACIDDI